MKVWKSLLLAFLGFLLLMSLVGFGIAFTLDSTVLRPGFVKSEVGKLDLAALAAEFRPEQGFQGDFPPEVQQALVDALPEIEPKLKESLGAFIDELYDYLLGRARSFEIRQSLRNTVLDRDFIASVLDDISLAPFIEQALRQQVLPGIPASERAYFEPYVDDIAAELEPGIKRQVITAIDPILAYAFFETSEINIVISLEPDAAAVARLRQTFISSPPAQLAALPPAQLGQLFDGYYGKYFGNVPSIVINESTLGNDVSRPFAEGLDDVQNALRNTRAGIGYFRVVYYTLIGAILLLALGIILIHRQVSGASRDIGVTLLVYGALEFAGVMVARYAIIPSISRSDLPAALQTWLPALINDTLSPLFWFSLGCLVAGAVLVAVSFAYRGPPPAPKAT